jgi:hypothetical protein
MKTISEHLESIENEVIRNKALAYYKLRNKHIFDELGNLLPHEKEMRTEKLHTAIDNAFGWGATNDGHDYWSTIHQSFMEQDPDNGEEEDVEWEDDDDDGE